LLIQQRIINRIAVSVGILICISIVQFNL